MGILSYKKNKGGVREMNKKILIPMMVLILVLIVPVLQYATAPKPQAIPFVGMNMVYVAVDWDGNTEIRTVSVLAYDSTTNCVTIRDSQDQIDSIKVDVTTREVISCSGTWPVPFYVEYWIPTNIKIGSHLMILDADAVVIGSTKLSVCGKTASVWEIQIKYTDGKVGEYGQDTWYYEKETGLWVGAAWVEYDSNGEVVANWGGHLVSTNVVLPEG